MERDIERKLVQKVKRSGGLAFKFVSPGLAGVPDRIVLMPKGQICFVEVKAPGKKMRPLQTKRKKAIEKLGFKVYCVDSFEKINRLIDEMGGDAK